MAQDTIDKIINIQFRYNELVEGIRLTRENIQVLNENVAQYKNQIKALEKEIESARKVFLDSNSTNGERIKAQETLIRLSKELRAAEEGLKKAERESIAQKKVLQETERQYTKELQNNIKIETQATGSINQLQANISKLTAQYYALSAAEREGDFGKRLAADIKSQQEAVTEAKKSLGDYRSQVGSYEEAIRAVLPAEMSQVVTLGKTIDKAGGVTKAFGLMTAAVGRMIKAALAFVATPLGAVLTALAVGAALVVKNWGKLTDALGITSPAREAAKAIEKLNEQLDYFNNRAEKNGTEALKRYTEALKNAKGDAEALAKAQRDYNIELLNAEYERARIAREAAYEAEAKAYAAYVRRQNDETTKSLQEAKDAVQKANADFAQADYERTKFHADALAKQVEDEKKAAEEAAKLRTAATKKAAEEEKKARIKAAEEAHEKLVALWDREQADETNRIGGLQMAIAQKEEEYKNRLLKAQTQGGDTNAQEEMIRIAQEQVNILQEQLQDVETFKTAYEAMGLSGIEIDNKRLEALKALQDAQKALQGAQNKAAEDERKAQERSTAMSIQSAQQLAGALGGLAEAAGADAGVVAMLAIAESAAAMGAALHKAFSSSATVWDGIAGAVAAISTITTIITQIKSLNSSAEEERSKYRYASGGLVTGPGTGTSDSIPAMLSNGEAVMTAQAVNDWGAMLSAMNVASGGNAIQVSNLPQRNDGMKGMERMMERALMNMPAPIVSVVDINKGQKRVKVQNSLGKLGRKKYE
nr:MAG TPA: tail tape measure protein [Caudoviricetes sp.]